MHPFHKKILDSYNKGLSVTKIAKLFNKDKKLIKKILFNFGLDLGNLKNPLTPCVKCGNAINLKVSPSGNIYPSCDNEECYTYYKNYIYEKRKKTTKKIYGVDNPAQSKEIQEKMKKTNRKKYGVDYPTQSTEIKKKIEKTLLKNYGVTAPSKSKKIVEKMKQTNLKKYGVENVRQNKEIHEKAIATCIEKYGVDNIFKSEEFKDAQRIAMLDTYGVEYYTQTEEMKNKTRTTMLNKYGAEYHSQCPELKEKVWKTYRKNYWDKFLEVLNNKKIKPLFNKNDYIKLSKELTYECLRCSTPLKFKFLNPYKMFCTCMVHRSSYEDEIIDWLNQEIKYKIKSNEKFYEDGKLKFEIDIYLPTKKLGIDFAGIYWHSDNYKHRNYHQDKYKYFQKLGINLIQIFENEWVNQEDIVKSIIKSRLALNTRIYARNCKIVTISKKECAQFLIQNHIQGTTGASIFTGLYYKDELVQVISLGKYRYGNNTNALELIRLASKKGTTVIGGFAKLLKYIEKKYNPIEIISFVDLRYFTGEGYKKCGFFIKHITKPNYFYFKNGKLQLHSRIQFQKHKLSSKLKNYDKNLSEFANMKNNGYHRIFDAGNLKMIKNF